MRRWIVPVLGLLALSGCARPLALQSFANSAPAFSPEVYFMGRTQSWGILETRDGAPQNPVAVDAIGRREADGTLVLTQAISYGDGGAEQRVWRLRRLDAHRYEGTANDVVGIARGEAYGNLFHWRYTLAREPGNPLKDVDIEHWMYLQPDGRTVINRATITKFGIVVGQLTERFTRGSDRIAGRRA